MQTKPTKRILNCQATCGDRFVKERIVSNSKELAEKCFSPVSRLDNAQSFASNLYLDSVLGSCSDEIYAEIQTVLDSYQVKEPEGKCEAKCMSNPSEVSVKAASVCFSYMSPPIIKQDYNYYYTTFKDMYVLSGNCTFKELNNLEQTIRKFIIDPKLVESIE